MEAGWTEPGWRPQCWTMDLVDGEDCCTNAATSDRMTNRPHSLDSWVSSMGLNVPRPYLGDVVDTLLEGQHDDLLQDGHGLIPGWVDTGQRILQLVWKNKQTEKTSKQPRSLVHTLRSLSEIIRTQRFILSVWIFFSASVLCFCFCFLIHWLKLDFQSYYLLFFIVHQ